MDDLIPNFSQAISHVEPETAAGRRRLERILELRRSGVVPSWWADMARKEADRDLPTEWVREHAGAWARVWDRPRQPESWMREEAFTALLEQYDRGTERNDHLDGLKREREQQATEQQRERDAADTARREAEAAELKERLRRQYLSLAGTTPEGFEAEYPELLRDYRKREMERTSDAVEEEMRRTVWQAMHRVD